MIVDSAEYYQNKILLNDDLRISTESSIQSLVDSYGLSYDVDLKNFKSLAEAKQKVESLLLASLASGWDKYYSAESSMLNAEYAELRQLGIDPTGELDKVAAVANKIAHLADNFKNIASGVSGVDFSKIGMSGSKGSSGSKSDSSPKPQDPSYTDPIDSIIRQINSQSQLTSTKNKSLSTELSQIKSSKEYALQLSKTNSLISSQKTEIDELNQANSTLKSKMDEIKHIGFGAVNWLDNSGELTTTYYDQYNSASKETQENMQKEADQLSKLTKSMRDNEKSIDELNSSQIELNSTISQIHFDIVTSQIDSYNKSIESTNSKLELSQARMSLLDDTSEEYRQELLNQTDAYQELISKQIESIDYMKLQLINDNLSIEAKESLTKSIEEATKSQLNYQLAIKDTAEDLATKVIETSKELAQAELDAEEEILNAYIKRKEAKIEVIQAEIDALKEINEIEEESEERARRLLAIEEAKLKLKNVQNEKNTRILVGDEWQWQSNPTDVLNAQNDLKSLQEDYNDWEDDNNLKHQEATLQAEIDYQQKLIDTKQESFDAQKLIFDEQWANLDVMADQLLKLYGDNVDSAVIKLSEKLVSLNSQLAELVNKTTSLPSSLSNGSSSKSSGSGSSGSGSSSSGTKITNVAGVGNVIEKNGQVTINTKSGSYNEVTGKYTITNHKTGKTTTETGSKEDYEKEYDKFHDGGWVDGKPKNLKLNEIPAILEKGEFVLSKEMLSKIPNLVDIAKNYMNNIKLPQMPNFTSNINNINKSSSNNNGGITIQNLTVNSNSATNLVAQLQSMVRLTDVQYT